MEHATVRNDVKPAKASPERKPPAENAPARIGPFRRALALILLLLPACEEEPAGPPPGPDTTGEFAFVTTSDFQTGSSSIIRLGDDRDKSTEKNVASIHCDAVARSFDNLIYVVNRYGADNIQILDPADGFATVRQFSVGNGADPHDIVLANATKAYVTRYNGTDLWIVDPSTGAHAGSIDLSVFADQDGIPEMDRLYLAGDLLFVSVQRIDRDTDWGPVGSSCLAVVDTRADTLVDADPATVGTQGIALSGTNPFSEIKRDAVTGNLYLACAGFWGAADGGVEAVNPVTLCSEGIVLAGSAVGGDVTDVEIVSAGTGYAVITDAGFLSMLLRFDPGSGAVTDTIYAPGEFVLQDIERSSGGMLLLTDRSVASPGIRLYDINTGAEITSAPIDVGLPPFDITIVGAINRTSRPCAGR